MKKSELGRRGEDEAAKYLIKNGYAVIARNYRAGHLETDIICEDETHTVFVEVKTRRNRLFADPEVAVGYQKIRNLQQAANHYVKYRNVSQNIRFDLVTVVGTPDGNTEIEHIENAF